jgi:outer membrane biosynthesis protein TonB
MSLSFIYSLFLHIFLLILLMFGFDYSKKYLPQEETILLELIPLDTITNVKTAITNNEFQKDKPLKRVDKNDKIEDKNIKTNINSDISSAIQNSLKEASQSKKSSKDEPKKDKNITQSKDEKVEKIPDSKIIKNTKPKIDKIAKSEVKTKNIKDNKKPNQAKKQVDKDEELAKSVLKSLQEGGQKAVKKQQNLKDLMDNAIRGDTTEDYKEANNLSMSEISLIRSQISRAWRVTAFSGGKDNRQLKVVIKLNLDKDGSIIELQVERKSPRGVQPQAYKAFVDSVIRAIHSASPLQNLPPDKYDTWEEMELIFDSTGMIY